ncbi:MAG: cobalamin-dependent protein, partial [Myxococcales bacterium]|nr:cobalamin-dependent protein [Myxococcales bacterium]
KGGETHQSAGKVVMATVKGDVHDIGKNIVGVVLSCNNYEVIDLGVMVPADKILDAAVEHGAIAVGLSGLITPSLDEMVHVAGEMQRRKMTLPLLIGGATTSRKHTAVKIAPRYSQPTVHVLDASRAVTVVGSLLGESTRDEFVRDNADEQQRLRAAHEAKHTKLVSLDEARARGAGVEHTQQPAKPEWLGVRELRVPLDEIVPYIDWTPFFQAWELRGTYPRILDDATQGEAARELFENARALLARIVEQKLFEARATYGFFRANREGDDIVLWADEARSEVLARFCMLRQQRDSKKGRCASLADFVAERGSDDYLGAFAVSAGHGVDALVARFEAEHDDYNAIMTKALADRLAEALAELLHERARREWGYGKSEALSKEELIAEKYRGIRPAAGYPACPDHSEKRTLFSLLEAETRAGITLTEHFAMLPAASVSGLYFSHPEARYFAVGPIAKDQVEDYARRKDVKVEEVERWLAPSLSYDP